MKNVKERTWIPVAFSLAGILFGTPSPAIGQAKPRKKLPIMAWHGPGIDLLSAEMMKKIADAGFTINMSFLGNREANLRALNMAQAAGLSLLVHDARISKLVEDATLPLDALELVVADYKDHPAFFGYYVLDEPNAAKFGRLAEIVRYLEVKDPAHPAYVNLFPTYANAAQLGAETYEEHVAAFLKTVRPPFLSYDHYPVTSNGLRADYYRNLEVIRAQAAAHGIPFWAFTLSVGHAVYPTPAEGHIRLQLFSDIAYGAKGLEYFTFATPLGTDYDWKPALIDPQGTETPTFALARTINREIQNLGPLILRWTSEAVFHSEPFPEGTSPLPADGPVRAVRNAPVVIGLFKDGRDELVMIVNRDYENARLAVLDFAPEIRGLSEVAKGGTPPIGVAWGNGDAAGTAAWLLPPGDTRIFRLLR